MEEPTQPFLQQIKEQIKAEAFRLGFDACGVATSAPVDAEMQIYFENWINHQYHADMTYMACYKEQRMNPALILEGSQSVISVALNYYPPQKIPETEAQIAWYAYGKDYHEVMKRKLHQLLAFIQHILHCQGRVCVDTVPLLERYWAQKAGLGWVGKNTLLILPKGGSCYFLGEILLDTSLPPDEPQQSRCGTCNRCIEACPAGALCRPYVLDARKCLSYQTIENRGMLSKETEKIMGNRIYGCDSCQKACPYHRYSSPTHITEFHASPQLLPISWEKWANLTLEEYRYIFKGSAVKRAKYEGLKRNIEAAIRNRKSE